MSPKRTSGAQPNTSYPKRVCDFCHIRKVYVTMKSGKHTNKAVCILCLARNNDIKNTDLTLMEYDL